MIRFVVIFLLGLIKIQGADRAEPTVADFLREEGFVEWAQSLPRLQGVTRDDIALALANEPINKNQRSWAMVLVTDAESLRELSNPRLTIMEIGDGDLHAPIFEIDSTGMLRRTITLLNESRVDSEGFCWTLPLKFQTQLTEAEMRHPLCAPYQLSVPFDTHNSSFPRKGGFRGGKEQKRAFLANIQKVFKIVANLAPDNQRNETIEASLEQLRALSALPVVPARAARP